MHELNTDINGAMAWAAKYHAEAEAKFLEGRKRVPSWSPEIDRQVQQYIDGLAYFLRGHECWIFESGRYLGNKGPEIRKSRQMPLVPKVPRDASLRRENIVLPHMDELMAELMAELRGVA